MTIFDVAKEDQSFDESDDIFDIARGMPDVIEEDTYFDVAKEYGKTALKGFVEGVSRFGRAFGPLDTGVSTQQQLEQQTEVLDEVLPTDEGFGQKVIRRGLKEIPTALSLPGGTVASTIGRGAGAAILGQGAEELGAPPVVQAAAELTAWFGPDVTKKLISGGKNKEIIDAARKLGISDEALTPLLQGETKQKWLTKLTPRRGTTERALKRTKGELSNAYHEIESSALASERLPDIQTENLFNQLDDLMMKLPSSQRSKIAQDLTDLKSNPVNGEALINFWGDINATFGKKSRQIQTLKEPIREALKQSNPALAQDFDLINDLYSKYFKIAKRLEPNLMSDLVGAGEALGLGVSFATGYYPTLVKFLGEKSARKLAQQMLINPKYQQIGQKFVTNLNERKLFLAHKNIKELSDLVRKSDSDAADILDEISEQELINLFTSQEEIGE